MLYEAKGLYRDCCNWNRLWKDLHSAVSMPYLVDATGNAAFLGSQHSWQNL